MKAVKLQADLPEMLGVRLDPEPRYLLELTTRIANCSSSVIVRKALELYFATAVSPRLLAEFEEPFANDGLPSPEMIQARKAQAERMQMQFPLTGYEHLLWDEKPFERLLKLHTFFPHLVSAFEQIVLSFAMQDDRYSKPVAQGRTYVVENINAANWELHQAEAFAWHKSTEEA